IESKLASLDVHSAWRLLPDVQIGIAHVKSDHRFDEVVALVCRMAANRVGVSARFDDLRDTPYTAPRSRCAAAATAYLGSRSSTAPSWPPPSSAPPRSWSNPLATC